LDVASVIEAYARERRAQVSARRERTGWKRQTYQNIRTNHDALKTVDGERSVVVR